jgi:hypothetical protein
MRYPKFRRQHLFIGSGVIEAGRKTVIASRLKHQECFGPCGEPLRFWRCAALISTAALRIILSAVARLGRLDFHF